MSGTSRRTVFDAHVERQALRGLVAILCDGRLAVLLLLVVIAVTRGQPGAAALVLVAVVPSWIPLRAWRERARQLEDSLSFLALDATTTVLVVWLAAATLADWGLGATYLLLSTALAGVVASRGRAVLTAALTCVIAAPFLIVGHAPGPSVVAVLLAGLGVAYAASSLAGQLRRQGVLVRRMLDTRAHAAAEAERAALAREMHDSLAKTLHGVSMLVDVLAQDLAEEDHRLAPLAGTAQDACRRAGLEAREVLTGLREPVEEDLDAMVRLTATRWGASQDTAVTIEVDPALEGREFPAAVVYGFRRILDELLENVARHAQASTVHVVLRVDEAARSLDLLVRDDGVGMSADSAETAALRGHFGLVGVRERSEMMGAEYSATDGDGGTGLSSRVRLPLEEIGTTLAAREGQDA